jgi:hypothetical protein
MPAWITSDQPHSLELEQSQWLASAVVVAGYAYGTLVERCGGRPTRLVGHPEHPSSLGAIDGYAAALLADLVDDQRSRNVLARGRPSTAASLFAAARERLATTRRSWAIVSGRVTSPSTARMLEALQRRHSGVRWFAWEPSAETHARAGARMLFGRPLHAVPRLDRARVIVSLDDDLFVARPGRLAHARAFAGRGARLHAAESFPTLTGAVADHRVQIRHGEVERLARALLVAVARGGPRRHEGWVEVAADELRRAGSAALVLAGDRQGPQVHALAHALNHQLGAIGRTVEFYEPFTRGPCAGVESLADLAGSLRAGEIDTVLLLDDVDPVRDAPADLELGRLLAEIPLTIHHGLRARAADWHLPAAHTLESWADARGHDGTPTLIQPVVAPAFGGYTAAELLAGLLGDSTSACALVRATWREHLPDRAAWQRAVGDGRLPADLYPVAPVELELSRASVDELALPRPPVIPACLELAFRPDPACPEPSPCAEGLLASAPVVGLGDAAFIGRETAARLGVEDGQLVHLKVDEDRTVSPIRILEDHPNEQITVGAGHPLRRSEGLWARAGVEVWPEPGVARTGPQASSAAGGSRVSVQVSCSRRLMPDRASLQRPDISSPSNSSSK